MKAFQYKRIDHRKNLPNLKFKWHAIGSDCITWNWHLVLSKLLWKCFFFSSLLSETLNDMDQRHLWSFNCRRKQMPRNVLKCFDWVRQWAWALSLILSAISHKTKVEASYRWGSISLPTFVLLCALKKIQVCTICQKSRYAPLYSTLR